jgi:hypothetical protein
MMLRTKLDVIPHLGQPSHRALKAKSKIDGISALDDWGARYLDISNSLVRHRLCDR